MTINKYDYLSIDELVDLFHKNKIIKFGSIGLFGDSIGKPGDTIYNLTGIRKINENTLEFTFGLTKIILHNPLNIYLDENSIIVQSCIKAEWLESDIKLSYSLILGKLHTELLEGKHTFRANHLENAFTLYCW